jgi:hypothetical protein
MENRARHCLPCTEKAKQREMRTDRQPSRDILRRFWWRGGRRRGELVVRLNILAGS